MCYNYERHFDSKRWPQDACVAVRRSEFFPSHYSQGHHSPLRSIGGRGFVSVAVNTNVIHNRSAVVTQSDAAGAIPKGRAFAIGKPAPHMRLRRYTAGPGVSDPDADVSVKLQRPTADRDAESSAEERKAFQSFIFFRRRPRRTGWVSPFCKPFRSSHKAPRHRPKPTLAVVVMELVAHGAWVADAKIPFWKSGRGTACSAPRRRAGISLNFLCSRDLAR
jgi:hypothetical protein